MLDIRELFHQICRHLVGEHSFHRFETHCSVDVYQRIAEVDGGASYYFVPVSVGQLIEG